MSPSITANEIKEIRGKYGLSQRAFAGVLGIGSASIARYEQGATPSKANANLIRAADNPQFMMECVERDGEMLTDTQREGVSRVYYATISLDEAEDAGADQEEARLMNEMYDHTLKQEVLNELAANIMGEIISTKIRSGFTGTAADVFDRLLDQLAALKPRIVSYETMNDQSLANIEGYLSCVREIVARQHMGDAA